MTTAAPAESGTVLERRRSAMLLAAVLLLGMLPLAYLGATQTTNEYLYRYVAYASAVVERDRVGLDPDAVADYPFIEFNEGFAVLLTTMSAITGLPPSAVQFLPLGAVGFLLGMLLVARRLTRDTGLAAGLTLALAFDPSLGLSNYNVWLYAFNVTWYLLFIHLTLRLLDKPSVAATACALIVFAASLTFHQTGPMWMAATWLGLAVALGWRAVRTQSQRGLFVNGSLLLVCAYVAFNKVVYRDFLPHLLEGGIAETGKNFFLRLLSFVGFSELARESHAAYAPGGGVLNAASLLQYVVILGALAIGLVALHRKLKRDGNWEAAGVPRDVLLVAALVATGVVDVCLYLARGGWLSLKYVALLYPLVAVYALSRAGNRRAAWGVVAALGAILLTKYVAFAAIDFAQPAEYEDTRAGAQWLARHAVVPEGDELLLLTDLTTFGHFLVHAPTDPPEFVDYDGATYSWAIGENADAPDPRPHHLVLNHVSGAFPVLSYDWRWYAPLGPQEGNLDANPDLHRAFTDGRLSVYAMREA